MGEGQAEAVGDLLREAGFGEIESRGATWPGSSGSWWAMRPGMSEIVSVKIDGAAAARSALERCVAGGGVAVFPADGLYGLACDPLDEGAIERIHLIKGRDEGKPSAVLYFSPLAMRELLDEPRAADRRGGRGAAARPGDAGRRQPRAALPARLSRGPRAARRPTDRRPAAGAMCPVFQTSANLSGEPAPAGLRRRPRAAIVDAVDLAIDGGQLTGLPSTVVDITAMTRTGASGRSCARAGSPSAT